MEKFIKALDDCMNFFYTNSLSIFDCMMIAILTHCIAEYSVWFCFGYIPFIWYSVKQKIKYDIINGD
jgi:hypothetical protein